MVAGVSYYMHADSPAARPAPTFTEFSRARGHDPTDAQTAQTALAALYRAHAVGLVRLAHVMVGDIPTAEDVVQEAFCGLYRRWGQLADQQKALHYLRASVLNGCRSALRRGRVRDRHATSAEPTATISAETAALAIQEQRMVMEAIRRLPDRQREVLILRFYLDEPEAEIARLMGIQQGTVRSTTHRALAALGHQLGGTL
jgi:RNA polymerase sigma-70 factor (sigma-E family)